MQRVYYEQKLFCPPVNQYQQKRKWRKENKRRSWKQVSIYDTKSNKLIRKVNLPFSDDNIIIRHVHSSTFGQVG